MPNAAEQAKPDYQPPASEGVMHGPYPDDGTPYSQLVGVQNAANEASKEGRISQEARAALGPGIIKLAEDGNRDRWKALTPEEQAAEIAEEQAEQQRHDEEDAREFAEAQTEAQKAKRLKQFYGDESEDPLAGDVDRFVPPEETRTDEQIDHDRRYAVEPYDDDTDQTIREIEDSDPDEDVREREDE